MAFIKLTASECRWKNDVAKRKCLNFEDVKKLIKNIIFKEFI